MDEQEQTPTLNDNLTSAPSSADADTIEQPVVRKRVATRASRAGVIFPPSRARKRFLAALKEDEQTGQRAGRWRLEKNVDLILAATAESVVRAALTELGVLAASNVTRRGQARKRKLITEQNMEALPRKNGDFAQLVKNLSPSGPQVPPPNPAEAISSSSSINPPALATVESVPPPDEPSPLTRRAVWQYEDAGWHDYDLAASDEVERCYQTYTRHPGMFDVRSIKSGHWAYCVDFPNMFQVNIQHENHTRRNIRRKVL
jgi:hypothetical protein